MRFECDSCHAKYKISDDKVRGRVVRFPCRKCDYKILIDGRKAEADVTVPAGTAYSFQEITRKSQPVSEFTSHEAATARARRPSAPVRRRPPSVPPRRPAAASRRVSSVPAVAATALTGQHPGLAPPMPAPAATPANDTADVPEWHVSINDVPVGPIRLEEMGHKIDAGAVSEYSLVWREGFDEWRPLATVPKLMALLHARRSSGPPPRSTFSSMPPFVETRTSHAEPSRPASVPAPPAAFAGLHEVADDAEIGPLADALQPELEAESGVNQMSQPPAPIGPEDVFHSAPQLGSFSGLAPTLEEPVSVPPVPPGPAAATAEPRRGLSVGVLALIVAVAVFSGVVAFLVFDRFGDRLMEKWIDGSARTEVESPAPKPAVAPAPVDAEEPAAVDDAALGASADGPAEETASDSKAASVGRDASGEGSESIDDAEPSKSEVSALVPPPDPSDNAPKLAPAREDSTRARRRARATSEDEAPESDLSADEQKLLDEFGSGADQAPAKIDVKQAGSAQSKKPPLDSDGVLSTVAANKPRLQRCYERAIRGQQSPGTVRLDVSVTVAPSGRVKNVTSEGSGPGGLAECIEASVRRWRFPASSEGGPAKFPLVFSAN